MESRQGSHTLVQGRRLAVLLRLCRGFAVRVRSALFTRGVCPGCVALGAQRLSRRGPKSRTHSVQKMIRFHRQRGNAPQPTKCTTITESGDSALATAQLVQEAVVQHCHDVFRKTKSCRRITMSEIPRSSRCVPTPSKITISEGVTTLQCGYLQSHLNFFL